MLNPKYYSHKGINSTLLLIGGSSTYTGAPYFTSLSSHRSGFELSYVMTHEEALIPLKILLPESIVLPIKCEKWILDRVSICIVGSGLGRVSLCVLEEIICILKYLMQKNIFFLFDGDGIFLFNEIKGIFKQYEKIILTPNYNEVKRISYPCDWYVIRKGKVDEISLRDVVRTVADAGSEKRCAGLGDVLCGVVASIVVKNMENTLDCLVMACKIMRRASCQAFMKRERSLMAHDVIEEIGGAFIYFHQCNGKS